MSQPNPNEMTKRPLFSSRFATIVTMIGVSVGLGNVWRFPYMMGEYGGSAFLFVYLVFTFLFAIPAVMAEWGLGRSTRQGPVGAFTAMWGKTAGKIIGSLLLLTVLIAESYYIYVIANIAFSSAFSFIHGFDAHHIENYNKSLGNPFIQYAIVVLLLALSYVVLVRDLKSGMEKISKIFVPFFVFAMLLLIVFALQLEGAGQHLIQFLKPDFSALHANEIFAALGQAFFSLGLGGTFLLIFGSYIRDEEPLTQSAAFMAIGDVGAAMMAGLFIVPTVLALGLELNEGPGLLFSTLPELFQRLPLGQGFGSLFLVALLTVTFISSLAALEVVLTGVHDALGGWVPRKRLMQILCVVVALIVIPIAIDPSIIGLLDLFFGSGMQLFGSLLAILALTWGQSRTKTLSAVFGDSQKVWHRGYYFWIKWCVPAALLLVLIGYIVSKLNS